MAGGRGRGRGRGTPADPSASGGPSASPSTPSTATATAGAMGGRRACEACEAAPGIPFCRVEWSFLCSSCGPNLHSNSWIVPVPPFPGPTLPPVPPNTSLGTGTSAGTDPSCQASPYYFPPYMQMPPMPPMQMQMVMPMHPPNTNANTTGVKRRRRRTRFTSSSKEQMTGAAPAETDTDPVHDHDRVGAESESAMQHSLKHKTRPRPPPAPTSTNTGKAYTGLHPGVKGTTITTNVPQSAEDGAQVDTMENIAAGMEPPPPELDETEQAIEPQGEQC